MPKTGEDSRRLRLWIALAIIAMSLGTVSILTWMGHDNAMNIVTTVLTTAVAAFLAIRN